MIIEWIPIIIALVGTAICAYDDWRTTYLNDKLVYAMLILGILWTVFTWNTNAMIFAAAVFAIGFAMYLFGQVGGGDVFLLTALTLLIPQYPAVFSPIAESLGITPVVFNAYPFVLPVFLFAALIGPMFYFSLRYFIRLIKTRDKVEDFDRKIMMSGLYAVMVIVLLAYFWFTFSKALVLFFIPIIPSFLIMPFKNDIIKHFCMEKKKVSKLTDDDVIALEFVSESVKKKLGLWRKTLTSPEIKTVQAKAKKEGITHILVCENLPYFVPFIFISLIVNFFVGDVLLYLLINF